MTFDRLTQRARMRFSELRDAAETAQSAIRTVQSSIGYNEKASRNFAGESEDNKKAQKLHLDEIARLSAKMPALQATHRALAGLLTRVEQFVAALPGHMTVSDAKAVMYELIDDEPHAERVQVVRDKIEELGARRRKAANSFLPVPELRQSVSDYVNALVAEGRPSIIQSVRGLEIKSQGPPAIALLAWNDPEALKESLNLDVDALVVDMQKRGLVQMSAKTRKSTIEKLDAEILALEREEQHFIREAAESGQHVLQRERADARAVLDIAVQRQAAPAAQAAE